MLKFGAVSRFLVERDEREGRFGNKRSVLGTGDRQKDDRKCCEIEVLNVSAVSGSNDSPFSHIQSLSERFPNV